jgi:hypothetical protein
MARLTHAVKPQQVHYKLEEAIEQPCSDILAHTPEVCKGTPSDQGCLATKDNHDSWEMCTTSVECRTIVTAMLRVLSGMAPHTIIETKNGMVWMLGWLVGCSLGQTATVDTMVGSMSHFEDKR